MPILTPAEALRKRDELIELGYAIVPGVLQNPLLDELRAWSHDVFERLPVDPKYRYQGSDIHVWTPRRWSETRRRRWWCRSRDWSRSRLQDPHPRAEIDRLPLELSFTLEPDPQILRGPFVP